METFTSKKVVKGFLLVVLIVFAAVSSICFFPQSANATMPTPSRDVYYDEISGPDRYATAVKALEELVYPNFPGLIIATGEAYPDTLSASSLAGLTGYPVLLSSSDHVPDVVIDCIKKHKPGHIIIIGSEAAISKSVEKSLQILSFVNKVERVGGSDRYKTSKAIYEYGKTIKTGWTLDDAILVTGENFADGVSIANYATSQSAPVFLVDSTTNIDQSTRDALALHKRVLLIGDSTRISTKTEKSLASYGSITEVVRLAGHNRYETNMRVSNFCLNDGLVPGLPSFSLEHYIATGINFPDALTLGISGAMSDEDAAVRVNIYLGDDTPEGRTFLKHFSGEPQYGYRIHFVGTQAATTPGLREATIKGIGGNPIIQY